jgi:hypothetical protein
VVDVGEFGGPVTAGESAAQIAGSDEFGQRGGGPVLGFGSAAWLLHEPDFGTAADQLGQQRGRHDPTAGHHRGCGAPRRGRSWCGISRCGISRCGISRWGVCAVGGGVGCGGRGVLVGHDVDHDVGGAGVVGGGGAVRLVAATPQVIGAGAQRAQGIGAALGLGAGIVGADTFGHRGEPAI